MGKKKKQKHYRLSDVEARLLWIYPPLQEDSRSIWGYMNGSSNFICERGLLEDLSDRLQ